jgi:hypothetical protein
MPVKLRRHFMTNDVSQQSKVLLTPEDVATTYSIPESTQAKGRMTGGFCPHIKCGRSVFYLKSDLENWIASLRRASTSDAGRAA